ncbi:hypothetical protein F4775DRAFT_561453 [Biscogniauxia sp. FL1348]|nr:hypothetical protein F4775DRAFT_561453 [Biscogniauxia sp. FL1348]
MSSEKDLDFSLPNTAPNSDRHRDTAGTSYTQAVYTLVPLAQSDLDALVGRLNSAQDIQPGTCKPAPQFDFSRPSSSLQHVYDYHIGLRDRDRSVHPLYFIVAISTDWDRDGVLIVHLDTGLGGQPDRTGMARCSVNWAASWGLNLDIGNMAWEDLKEDEQIDWGDRAIGTEEASAPDSQSAQPTNPQEAPRNQYASFAVVPTALELPDQLEPDWMEKPVAQRRIFMGGNYSSEPGGLSAVVRRFPWFCKSYPEVHRQVAIVADKPDFEGEGVLLLRFDWDGDVDAHDDDSISSLSLNYGQVRRVPASRAVAELDAYCREQGL